MIPFVTKTLRRLDCRSKHCENTKTFSKETQSFNSSFVCFFCVVIMAESDTLPNEWYQDDIPEPVCFGSKYNFYQHNWQEPFCEGLVYRHQYLSCLTDFWILGMSFWQLSWDHNFTLMRWAAALFGVNAVGSFFNDWYGTRQWMVMDNSSMYILIWIVVTAVWSTTFRYQRKLRGLKPCDELQKGHIFQCIMVLHHEHRITQLTLSQRLQLYKDRCT